MWETVSGFSLASACGSGKEMKPLPNETQCSAMTTELVFSVHRPCVSHSGPLQGRSSYRVQASSLQEPRGYRDPHDPANWRFVFMVLSDVLDGKGNGRKVKTSLLTTEAHRHSHL